MFSSGRNRHRFVIVVVSFVKKRVSRGVVSLTTGSLSLLFPALSLHIQRGLFGEVTIGRLVTQQALR